MHNLGHGNNDDGLWRSDAARLLAEKVANKQATYDSLDVNVNIDNILAKRDPGVLRLIEAAIEAQMPFILHSSFEHHVMIIPKTGAIVTYTNGVKSSVQFAKGKNFQNIVRMCVFIYPKFFVPVKKELPSGGHVPKFPTVMLTSNEADPVLSLEQSRLLGECMAAKDKQRPYPYEKGKGGIIPAPGETGMDTSEGPSHTVVVSGPNGVDSDGDIMLPGAFRDSIKRIKRVYNAYNPTDNPFFSKTDVWRLTFETLQKDIDALKANEDGDTGVFIPEIYKLQANRADPFNDASPNDYPPIE